MAHQIVKETTEARLKNYLAQKNLGRHSVKLEKGALVYVRKEMLEWNKQRTAI